MEEKTSTSNEVATKPAKEQHQEVAVAETVRETRQAYGTAKTENLRDSGLWRIVLPGFVLICCALLFAIPLGILVPLFMQSIDTASPTGPQALNLIWLWIGMAVIEILVALIVIQGFRKIFFTQAGNYRH